MENDSEQRFTLHEAQRELARRECNRYGHDWDVLTTMAAPCAIVCGRCGWSGAVTMDERAKATPPTEVPA